MNDIPDERSAIQNGGRPLEGIWHLRPVHLVGFYALVALSGLIFWAVLPDLHREPRADPANAPSANAAGNLGEAIVLDLRIVTPRIFIREGDEIEVSGSGADGDPIRAKVIEVRPTSGQESPPAAGATLAPAVRQ